MSQTYYVLKTALIAAWNLGFEHSHIRPANRYEVKLSGKQYNVWNANNAINNTYFHDLPMVLIEFGKFHPKRVEFPSS